MICRSEKGYIIAKNQKSSIITTTKLTSFDKERNEQIINSD